MVLGTADSTEVLAQYYLRRLLPFFEGQRSVAYLAFPSGRKKRALIHEIEGLKRYLDDSNRDQADSLARFVQKKDDLDYQHASPKPFEVLVLFARRIYLQFADNVSILHAILVHAFIGGWF